MPVSRTSPRAPNPASVQAARKPRRRGARTRRRSSLTCASALCLCLGLAALELAPAASAAPTVKLVARAVPIPGFRGTGDKLGAGAAVEAKYTIHGSESSGGVPSQITHINFYLPAGARLHPQGFVVCKPATLENFGPSACPHKSQASPIGSAGVVDPIGDELVRERSTLQAFFAPGGGLQFYVNAASPISAQLLVARGRFRTAARPYGPELSTAVQEVDSVPGAPPVSTESINIKVGAAYRHRGHMVSYGTMPRKCPRHGFPVKSEITFASGETVTTVYRAPCPPHRRHRR